MNKNIISAMFILAIMMGYSVYTEGMIIGLFLFFQLYIVIFSMLLAGWLIYRLAMGTWSMNRILKNAKKLRTPEEQLEYGSEYNRFLGMKLFMIVGGVVALMGLIVKIVSDWK